MLIKQSPEKYWLSEVSNTLHFSHVVLFLVSILTTQEMWVSEHCNIGPLWQCFSQVIISLCETYYEKHGNQKQIKNHTFLDFMLKAIACLTDPVSLVPMNLLPPEGCFWWMAWMWALISHVFHGYKILKLISTVYNKKSLIYINFICLNGSQSVSCWPLHMPGWMLHSTWELFWLYPIEVLRSQMDVHTISWEFWDYRCTLLGLAWDGFRGYKLSSVLTNYFPLI